MASERRERAHGTTAWVVGVVATPLTHTHTHQRGWHHSGRVCVVPPHTLTHSGHSGQGGAAHTVVVVGGKGTQWWWQPHHTHSHHHHVPITPCVCVNREWTAPAQPVSGPSGHTRHNTHAATTTSTSTTTSSSKRRSGVVWGTRSGWTCEWRARRGHSQHRGHTHTTQHTQQQKSEGQATKHKGGV